MSKCTFTLVCVAAVCLSGAYGFTEEQRKAIHEGVKPIVSECSKVHGVTQEQIDAAQKLDNVDTQYPCFLACAFKKAGILTEQGEYNTESGMNVLKSFLSEEEFPVYVEKGKRCGLANSESVSDGDAGCERAKHVMTCFRQQDIELVL